jgi:hypothetical protein
VRIVVASAALLAALLALPPSACAIDDGPLDGTVIDARTGERLAGVLIAATWMRSEEAAHAPPGCWHAQTAGSNSKGRYHIDSWGRPWSPGDLVYGHFVLQLRGYKQGYRQLRASAEEAAHRPGEIRMQRVSESNKDRFAYLRGDLVFDCRGAGVERNALVPFATAVYAEASMVATRSVEDQRALRLIAHNLRQLRSDPNQPASSDGMAIPRAEPPPVRPLAVPAPTDAARSAVPPR